MDSSQPRSRLIVAGGGVLYSRGDARRWQNLPKPTGIPVGETQAGKGALPYDHPQESGRHGRNRHAGRKYPGREADLIIGIGTRYSDFTTASKTAFQNPDVRFININVAEFDAYQTRGAASDRRMPLSPLRNLAMLLRG